MQLIDFVRDWADNVKQQEVKQATYDRLITSIDALSLNDIANKEVDEITIQDVQAYVNGLVHKGYSLSTIKKQMRIVSAPLGYAVRNNLLSYNPCMAVKVPNPARILKPPRKIEAYDKDQQKALRDVFNAKPNSAFMLAEFMMETGCRVGEAMALHWDDVDLIKRKLKIHATVVNLRNGQYSFIQEGAKSRTSNRTIPLSHRAVEILEWMQKNTCGELIFVDSKNKPVTYDYLRYHIIRACRKAGVTFYGMHVFRHTFATNQYYKKTDVKVLSKILGHADPSITYNVYIHLYGDGFEDMLQVID